MLLKHPRVDVNAKKSNGMTAFAICCRWNCAKVAKLLLQDHRVSLGGQSHIGIGESFFGPGLGAGLGTGSGYTPEDWLVISKHSDVAKCWIASGRDMSLSPVSELLSTDDIILEKLLEIIDDDDVRQRFVVIWLLKSFNSNPQLVRYQTRLELGGFKEEPAAELFALVIFVCDDYLCSREQQQTQQHKQANDRTVTRFFAMTSRLPMELQMIICHRVVGSVAELIHGYNVKIALRRLASVFVEHSCV